MDPNGGLVSRLLEVQLAGKQLVDILKISEQAAREIFIGTISKFATRFPISFGEISSLFH